MATQELPLQTDGDVGGLVANAIEQLGVPAKYAGDIGSFLTFLITFAVLYLVGRTFLLPLIDRVLSKRNLDKHAMRPLKKIANLLVIFAAVAISFGMAGYGDFLTSLATVAAAATLAIGLAMQDVLKNLVAGVFIYTDRPFRIDDWIEWDGHSGVVEDISLRVTRVRTFDNELLTVPNSHLTDGVIKNPVAKDTLRLKTLFGIGYDDDIDQATEIIVEEAADHPEILSDPGPSVRLTELGDSSVGLQARYWIADPSRSDAVKIKGEYVTAVKQRFDDAGIDIPYPNRELSGTLEVASDHGVVEAADD
jgi:small-conductance mechanosensitive channel